MGEFSPFWAASPVIREKFKRSSRVARKARLPKSSVPALTCVRCSRGWAREASRGLHAPHTPYSEAEDPSEGDRSA